jgi:hypothetical protein
MTDSSAFPIGEAENFGRTERGFIKFNGFICVLHGEVRAHRRIAKGICIHGMSPKKKVIVLEWLNG